MRTRVKKRSGFPDVLTPGAVAAGRMPAAGQSGLPASLEQDIPGDYRYWKSADAAIAKSCRDALVESGLVGPSEVLVVDGALRRVTTKRFLVKTDPVVKTTDPAVGDRVYVDPAKAHMPEASGMGTVAEISTSAIGIRFDQDKEEVHHWYVASELSTPPMAKRLPAAAVAVAQLDVSDKPVVAFDAPTAAVDVAADVLEKSASADGPWLVQYEDTAAARTALHASAAEVVFKLATRPELVFASSLDVRASSTLARVVEAEPDAVDLAVEKALSKPSRLLKTDVAADAPVEKRLVYGIVLEPLDTPDQADTQGDIYSAEEIEKAAHRFMESYGKVGLQHKLDVTKTGVSIVENVVAPVEFTMGDQTVKKGTWYQVLHVNSDDIWKGVKDGTLTGLSIGGDAIRTPVT